MLKLRESEFEQNKHNKKSLAAEAARDLKALARGL